MNNSEHARVRRLRRRANRLGAHGYRIVPHRHGSGTRTKVGWHLIENVTNILVAPSSDFDSAPLNDIEVSLERLERKGEAL